MEIKGIKEGILVTIDEQDWSKFRHDLIKHIQSNLEFFKGAHLFLDVGNLVVRAREMGSLRDLLSELGVILSGVLTLSMETQETIRLLGLTTDVRKPIVKTGTQLRPLDTVLSGDSAILIHRTMRSGFKVAYQGHVVVLGDVNPGAEIVASGSVVIWGRLRGTVHAGAQGDTKAVVCALELAPSLLRIATKIATTPKDTQKPQPEVASIKDNQIIAETWQHKQGDL